jgi:competence protein ComEC
MRLGAHLRERVVSAIEGAMPGADGALYSRLLVGMVYGLEAAPLPEEIVEQFRRAGTVHLLVVSGAQISMLAIAIVGLTGGSFGRMRPWQAALAAVAVLLLVAIVGMEASVGRAVAMFALVLIAAVSARDYDVYTALGLAAALILLTDPQALLSLSFQLTFAATLGVVVFMPRQPLESIPGVRAAAPLPQIRGIIWGTAGAWALTSPLLAHHFSAFALSGNLANLANVPLSGIVLVLGFIALPIALVPALAPLLTLLCALARVILRLVMHVNDLAAALPAPFVEGVHLNAGGCVACYGVLALVLALGLHRRAQRALDRALVRLDGRRAWWVVGALAALPLVTLLLSAGPPREMELTLLPVGAGQCAIVRSPSGGTLMLDCGGGGNHAGAGREVAEGIVLPWLVRRRIERIDALCVSHWDADHCNALPTLLEAMPVETLLLPPELPGAEPPEELRSRRLLPVAQAIAGGRLDLGEGVTAELLAPRFPLLTEGRDDANANSVVMMLAHGDVRVLLTGDADRSATTRLIRDARNSGRSLYADVLVLPHHGRRLAEYEALLDAVAPTWAIVSCDEDAGRYLGEEELALLQRRGIGLLRTDEHGAVTICSDGRAVAVTTSRGAHSPGSRLAAARG